MAISMPIFVLDARMAWGGEGWGGAKCFFKKIKGAVELLFKHEFNKMLEKNFFPIHCAINHSFRVSTKTVYIL